MTKLVLTYTDDAIRDLDAVLLQAAAGWGIEQMLKRQQKLLMAFDSITANPNIGTIRELRAGTYRRFFIDPHYIYYRVLPGTIEISRIVHQRQEPV